MLRRIVTILFTITLFSAFLSAQEHTILSADGKIIKHKGDLKNLEIVSAKKNKNKTSNQNFIENFSSAPNNPLNTIDTLRPPGPWQTNAFVHYGQDVMVQWYVAPADMFINQVGFACKNNDPDGVVTVEVKIVAMNWSYEDLLNAPVTYRGYYEATGNGFNDITAFLDNADRTGDWVSIDGSAEPFGNDLWGDAGAGWPIVAFNQAAQGTYQWVDLVPFGAPDIQAGDIFGIAIKNTDPNIASTDFGVSYWYGDMDIGGWKFYAYGRLVSPPLPDPDLGWWSREFTWDFVAEVELYGDRGPVINSYTQVPSGLDTGPFTVDADITDDNPGDPSGAGVDTAILQWSTDGGTIWTDVTMSGTEPSFTGDIPAQAPNTTVDYRIVATDVNANATTQNALPFYVFGPTTTTLVVFNGFDGASGYPQSYYWGSGDWPNSYDFLQFERDTWAYGALTAGVVDNYTDIIEITTNGPADINNDVIRTWLEADAGHNYMLAGDEWLGAQSGWPAELPHAAGSFHFDILGINMEYNDLVSASSDISTVMPQAGTLLGGAVFDLYTQVSADNSWTAPMTYDPSYEIGGGVTNWLDGADFEADVEVDMKAVSLRASDSLTVHNIAGHRTLPAGNKIAFFAYDPLSLSSDTPNGVEYWWYGFTLEAPQVEVLNWFGIPTNVGVVNNLIPDEFAISQNYPNPFNPSTTINFSIPKQSNVVLKVYDILGSEVATLFEGAKNAGNYEVDFDASNLASGMYIYTLRAGDFTTSKKMMLLK